MAFRQVQENKPQTDGKSFLKLAKKNYPSCIDAVVVVVAIVVVAIVIVAIVVVTLKSFARKALDSWIHFLDVVPLLYQGHIMNFGKLNKDKFQQIFGPRNLF